MKLYLGCGPSPVHPQHLEVLGDPKDWTFIDLYVHEPHIKQWDARILDEVPPSSVEYMYASHLLEHFPHTQVKAILKAWQSKLVDGGKLTLNVPDLTWAAWQIIKYDQGGALEGYYYTFGGEHGLLSVVYGSQSHDGEYHKSGYTKYALECLLAEVGLTDIAVEQKFDAHEMGVLIATCLKSQ